VGAALLDAGRAYLAVGGLVGAAFVLWGIDRIDARARGAYAFRPLILPGVALLWPFVAWRWRRIARGAGAGAADRPPRRAQDRLTLALAVALPAILVLGLVLRPDGPRERPAVQIAAPEAR
jgi:hypothetical protein